MKVYNAIKEKLAKAVEAYYGELLKVPKVQKGLCTIARSHKVDYNTLAYAINGKKSINNANTMK